MTYYIPSGTYNKEAGSYYGAGGDIPRQIEGKNINGARMDAYSFVNFLGIYYSDLNWNFGNTFTAPMDKVTQSISALSRPYDCIVRVDPSGLFTPPTGDVSGYYDPAVYFTNNYVQNLAKDIANKYKIWWHYLDESASGNYYRPFYSTMFHINDINPFQVISGYVRPPITGGIYSSILGQFNSDDYVVISGYDVEDNLSSGIVPFASGVNTFVTTGSRINFDYIQHKEISPIINQVASYVEYIYDNPKTLELNGTNIPQPDNSYIREKLVIYDPVIVQENNTIITTPGTIPKDYYPTFSWFPLNSTNIFNVEYPYNTLWQILKLNNLNIRPDEFIPSVLIGTKPLYSGYISDLDMTQQTIFPNIFNDQGCFKTTLYHYYESPIPFVAGDIIPIKSAQYYWTHVLPSGSGFYPRCAFSPYLGDTLIDQFGIPFSMYSETLPKSFEISRPPTPTLSSVQFPIYFDKSYLGLMEDKDVHMAWTVTGGNTTKVWDGSTTETWAWNVQNVQRSYYTEVDDRIVTILTDFGVPIIHIYTHPFINKDLVTADIWQGEVVGPVVDLEVTWLDGGLGLPGEKYSVEWGQWHVVRTLYKYTESLWYTTEGETSATSTKHIELSVDPAVGFSVSCAGGTYSRPAALEDYVTFPATGFYTIDYPQGYITPEAAASGIGPTNKDWVKLNIDEFYKTGDRFTPKIDPKELSIIGNGSLISTRFAGLNQFNFIVAPRITWTETNHLESINMPHPPDCEYGSYTLPELRGPMYPGFTYDGLGLSAGGLPVPTSTYYSQVRPSFTIYWWKKYTRNAILVDTVSINNNPLNIICDNLSVSLDIDYVPIEAKDLGTTNYSFL